MEGKSPSTASGAVRELPVFTPLSEGPSCLAGTGKIEFVFATTWIS